MINLIVVSSLLIISALSLRGSYPECGNGKVSPPALSFSSTKEDEWFREDEYKPIRLGIYYYDLDLGSEEDNDYFQNKIMPIVTNYFSRVLLVKRLKRNLVIRADTCSDDVQIPESHQTEGLADTDLVIYITSENLPEESFVAAAGACYLQSMGFNNVLAGSVLVNTPLYHEVTEEMKVSLMTHEITHVLGFTDGLFDYYHKPNGEFYASDEILLNKEVRGTSRYMVKTPTVLEEARRVFDCDELEGLELENNGGSGSAGSHWEQRLAFHDYMAAQMTTDTLYTTFTFALLKDSGWYEIDWSYTQEPAFGVGGGCGFVENLCVDEQQEPLTDQFCSKIQDRCDIFHLHKGFCDVTVHGEPLEDIYRYHDHPSIGGKGKYRDYCPVIREYNEGSCRGLGVESTKVNDFYGEIVCENCRCFEGTLVREEVVKTETEFHTACYEVVECLEDRAVIRIGNGMFGFETVECMLGAEAQDIEVPGYTGYLKCPASDILCGHIPCINNCGGRGRCVNGQCQCDPGFGGTSCEAECYESCSTCSGPTPFDCLSCNGENTMLKHSGSCGCKVSFTKVDGACVCVDGTVGEDGVCYEGCGDLCANCDYELEECMECVENAEKIGKKCSCMNNYYEFGGECVSPPMPLFSSFLQ